MPDHRPADAIAATAPIETEQARQARETADAVFRPKPQTARADDKSATARVPRILTVSQPEPGMAHAPEALAEPQARASAQEVPEIPEAEYRRIYTLATYGMTIKEVAGLYGVDARKIEQIVAKLTRAR